MNPTVNTTVNDVFALPLPPRENEAVVKINVRKLIDLAQRDWDNFEISPNFHISPIEKSGESICESYKNWNLENQRKILEFQVAEEENNSSFIFSMEVTEDVSPLVPIEQVSLTVNPRYRYGMDVGDSERIQRFTRDTAVELVSYAIGCMMGRYSLDSPGLIYAHAGNVGFDASRYTTFPADADGIVPLTDELWFEDDAASRIREFLLAVWGADTLSENMAWLAESLGAKVSETPEETIRRYLADKFFKDHLQTYKKRPIYWLFSSGKQGAFQALVYLHRYNEGTLARLRAEHVLPLTGKIQSRIDMLQKDVAAASSTAARNKLAKDVEKLKKKHVELLAYDEILRHHADMRITLDLDDGVKVNYGRFGNLLAEVKAVTGGKDDE
jgi:type II restriction/modification system DNA methylase subunit YeeA